MTKWVMVFALVGALGGCSKGDSIDLGLPRNELMSSLTSTDLMNACLRGTSEQQLSDSTIRGGCAFQLLSQGPAACTAGLDDCVASTKTNLAMNNSSTQCSSSANTDTSRYKSCAATVGEFEDCLSAVYDTEVAFDNGITCNSSPTTKAPDTSNLPACAPAMQKCPTFFSTSMVSSGSQPTGG